MDSKSGCSNINRDRHVTDEIRKKISIGRSKFLKEHPEQYPWRRKDKFKSVPCEHLKKILQENGYQFQEEFHDSRWTRHFSLDIAFLDKKIAVEVNGTQHYDKKGNLTPYYQERHKYLEDQGWMILEIFYTNVYKQIEIDKIKKAIDERKPISDEEQKTLIQILKKRKEENELKKKEKETKRKRIFKGRVKFPIVRLRRIFHKVISNFKLIAKEEKKQEELKRFEKAKHEGIVDSLGRITSAKYPFEIWNKRKEKILSCKIDFTKFGWIGKIMQETGMTKRVIENTIKHFPSDFSHCYFKTK